MTHMHDLYIYGVAMVSRIDKIIGLFCRILSLLRGSFAKETYNFIDPTNQSHPICAYVYIEIYFMCTCVYIDFVFTFVLTDGTADVHARRVTQL